MEWVLIATAEIIWGWMRLDDSQEWWLGKGLEGGAHGPIQGGIVHLLPTVQNDGNNVQIKSG